MFSNRFQEHPANLGRVQNYADLNLSDLALTLTSWPQRIEEGKNAQQGFWNSSFLTFIYLPPGKVPTFQVVFHSSLYRSIYSAFSSS